MANTRILLSIEDIDARIAEHRRQAQRHTDEADKLETFKRLALDFGSMVTAENPGNDPLPYTGLGAKRAAIKYLRDKGSTEGTSSLAKALVEGGLETSSKTFYRTLFNTLKAASKRKNSEIVKIGNQWALKEWESTA